MSTLRGVLLVVIGLELVAVVDAGAVPMFARREGANCQMCHFRPPELNEDGHNYLRRGIREEPPGEDEAGEEETGRVPVAAEERPLGKPLPVQWGNYLTAMGHHMFVAQNGQRPDFEAGEFDMWLAGPTNPSWSALANPAIEIDEGNAEVEKAYGEYISHWGEKFWSLRFGKTTPMAILFNQGGPRMPLSGPLILSRSADTGAGWTADAPMTGAEFGVLDLERWNAYAGAGEPDIDDDEQSEDHIDLYGSAQYIFNEDLTVTAYGYWGSAELDMVEGRQDFDRLALFGSAFQPSAKWTVGYMTGTDDLPEGGDLDTSGFFGLYERLLSDRWAVYGRYDHFTRDLMQGGDETLEGPTVGVTWWAQTEVRLTAEGQIIDVPNGEDERSLKTEFLWVF